MDRTYEVDPVTGCWNYRKRGTGGYGRVMLNYKSYVASRLFYIVHFGNIPPGRFVCHSCDNPSCVNPDHLFLGTQKDNIQDMIAKGRSPRGKPILNEDKVRYAREQYAKGVTVKAIGEQLGVHENTVYAVVKYRTWKFVT